MTDRTVRRRVAWCSVALATTPLVAACSGSGGDPSTTAASSPNPSSGSSAGPGATPDPTAGSATPSATGTPGQALATRDFTANGTYTKTRLKMRFDITELKRRGDLMDLTATVTNLEEDRDRDLRWQVGTQFQGPSRNDIGFSGGAFSGVVLTDVAGKKRYLVAADSGDSCVCTVDLGSIFVDTGQTAELNATYAAPPLSTTKLDVAVPSLGTFRDLPIS